MLGRVRKGREPATPAAPVSAEEAASEKEEVVYIMSDSAGNVQNVNVVNIFSGGDVTDYGNYTAVRMMNTDAAIKSDGDRITFSAEEKRVYYQGTLEDAETEIDDQISSVLDTLGGSSGEVYSFVSEKNTNVSSVQFVIKTAAIEEKKEAAEEAQEESKPTFWEKLLGLGSFFR